MKNKQLANYKPNRKKKQPNKFKRGLISKKLFKFIKFFEK